MSVAFFNVTITISPILEEEGEILGYCFVANGNEFENTEILDAEVHQFLHEYATLEAVGQAENCTSLELWIMFLINIIFHDLPFRDYIRMDYAYLPAPDGSSDPDCPPEDLPPGPGCEVQ